MAFTDFSTLNKVREMFPHIKIVYEDFIAQKIKPFRYSVSLKNEIELSLSTQKPGEWFASFFLIAPLLKAAWNKHIQNLNLWVQTRLYADDILTGFPDFLITGLNKKQYSFLSAPMLAVVEAKEENFKEGWGQCAAEMLACQKINQNKDIDIFGIVCTGYVWEFAKLSQETLQIDTHVFTVSELQKLLNVLNYFFEEVEKQLPLVDTTIILNTE